MSFTFHSFKLMNMLTWHNVELVQQYINYILQRDRDICWLIFRQQDNHNTFR